MADLLWSDSDSERARSSLRQTLSVLRQDLMQAGLDIIETRKDVIALKAGAVDVDVDGFEAGLTAQSPHELDMALAYYSGPFLEGFLLGSSTFDDWAAAERERLLNRAVESLEKLAHLVDLEKGLSLADRLLAMEPTREASYRLKMELLLAGGHRDKAIRTYEACRKVLKKEFGVEVSAETRALGQSLSSAGESQQNYKLQQPANGVATSYVGRPSISVADIINLTGDRREDYFAKGLVQDIVTALLQKRDYIVISSPQALEQSAASASGAHYRLSGTVQRSGHDIRVNVQLIDVANGHNVWGQRFDGRSKDALEFQDQIARSITLALGIEQQLTNRKALDKSPPGPPEVRRLVNEALACCYEMTKESLAASMELAEKAIAIAPDNPRAKRTLSVATTIALAFGALPRRDEHIPRALQLAEAAVQAVPDDEIARCVLSFALECAGRIDEAVVECRHAVTLNSSYSIAHGDLAELYALRGQVNEALHEANESFRLGGLDVTDFWRHHTIALAKFAGGDDQRALEVARKVVRSKPGFVRGALYWAAAAAATGNNEEASRAIHHCLSQLPHLTLGNVSPGFVPRYVKEDHHARFLEMLSRAGLPFS